MVIRPGARGKNPVRNFARLGALSLVRDAGSAGGVNVQRNYPGIPLGNNIHVGLANPDIEALAMASPAVPSGIAAQRGNCRPREERFLLDLTLITWS